MTTLEIIQTTMIAIIAIFNLIREQIHKRRRHTAKYQIKALQNIILEKEERKRKN